MFHGFSSKQVDRDDYAALVVKAFADSGGGVFRYDRESFSVQRADGLKVNLHNAYARFCSVEKQHRQAAIMELVSAFTAKPSAPKDSEEWKSKLLPAVRTASYFSLVQLQSKANGNEQKGREIASKQIADDLAMCVAYDDDRMISLLNWESLMKREIEFEEALKVARDNLREKTDPSLLVERAPGFFVGQWNDSYESSRIVLTDLIYRLPLAGDPVAFVPSRNQLWVTGSANAGVIESMLKAGQNEHFGAYPLSPYLFVLRDQRWATFQPESKAAQESLRLIELRRLSLDYSQQKGSLETIHRQDTSNVFVSPFQVSKEKGTERLYSISVWPKNVETLLPRTEKVAILINVETKDSFAVTWRVMNSVVGHLLEEQTGLFPERYRVRSFPSEAEIAALRQSASS